MIDDLAPGRWRRLGLRLEVRPPEGPSVLLCPSRGDAYVLHADGTASAAGVVRSGGVRWTLIRGAWQRFPAAPARP